jgi:error-prone DNA polymerase
LGDAFFCFNLNQREAMWQILGYHLLTHLKSPVQLNLFSGFPNSVRSGQKEFKKMNDYEAISADYAVYGLSTRGHLMSVIRKQWPQLPKMTTSRAKEFRHNRTIQIAGLSIVMQRPPTAAGTAFATIEDETGFLDLIFFKSTYDKVKEIIMDHCFVLVQGKIQRDGLSVSLVVQSVKPILEQSASQPVHQGTSDTMSNLTITIP